MFRSAALVCCNGIFAEFANFYAPGRKPTRKTRHLFGTHVANGTSRVLFNARDMTQTRKMRLLVGYNGTPFAKAAIEELSRAGLPPNVDALVLTVAELCCPTVQSGDAEQVAAEGAGFLRSRFPEWYVVTQTVTGVPIREMIAAEQSFKADLVVLGEPGVRADGKPTSFLGPVSQGVLTGGKSSLRITRTHATLEETPPNLLVGFDGSDGADKAVAAIASRSWPIGTSVRLLSIDDTGVLGTIRNLSPQLRAAAVGAGFASRWAETLASKALKQLTEAGLDASVEVRSGHPQNALIEGASDSNADCIFVGPNKCESSLDHFLLGSVSASVAAHANCTVEIVR